MNMNMNLKKIKRVTFLCLYYGFAQYLPDSYLPYGKIPNAIRIFCVKRIFKKCGAINTINRKVRFGNGANIEIGDYSGIGANVDIPNDTKIGRYVMIGRQTHILHGNHEFSRTDIPINEQGIKEYKTTIIEDDCWIGMRTFMTPGHIIRRGSIVAACSVITKDVDEYSIVGGNPARIIKYRNQKSN